MLFFYKKDLFNRINILNLPPHYKGRNVVLLCANAKIAQLVERDLAKVEVAGSSPVFRSKINARMVLYLINFF